MASLHPAHGARVVLERESSTEVRYRVSIYEPRALHTSVALIEGSAVALEPWSSEPPAWALGFAERLLKGLAKKHAADGSWPRKITRWRDARE